MELAEETVENERLMPLAGFQGSEVDDSASLIESDTFLRNGGGGR